MLSADFDRSGSRAPVDQRSVLVSLSPEQLPEWCTAAICRSVPDPDIVRAGVAACQSMTNTVISFLPDFGRRGPFP